MSGFQSSFAEMLCDFCSYESKNRYENSGGMNNIKDQHAGFVIASLEKCPNFIRTIGRHPDNLMYWLVRLGSIK